MSDPFNILVGAENLSDAATLAFSSGAAAAGYPLTNLQRAPIGLPLRTTTKVATLAINMPAAQPAGLTAVVLIKHNFTATAVVDVDVTLDVFTEVASEEDIDVDRYGFWPFLVDGQSRNSFLWIGELGSTWDRIVLGISDTSNPDGYLQIARLAVLPLEAPENGFAYGWSMRWEDPSEVTTTPGGNDVARRLRKRRVFDCELQNASHAEAFTSFFEGVDARIGKTGDCLVIPFPPATFTDLASTLHQRLHWGRQAELGAVGGPVFRQHSKPLSFLERT